MGREIIVIAIALAKVFSDSIKNTVFLFNHFLYCRSIFGPRADTYGMSDMPSTNYHSNRRRADQRSVSLQYAGIYFGVSVLIIRAYHRNMTYGLYTYTGFYSDLEVAIYCK